MGSSKFLAVINEELCLHTCSLIRWVLNPGKCKLLVYAPYVMPLLLHARCSADATTSPPLHTMQDHPPQCACNLLLLPLLLCCLAV
jgi:hypothetical protein